MEKGKVYWITGLSGSGKTTIGKKIYDKVQEIEKNTVFLDGDELREVFGNDLGYSEEDRKKCAMRYSKICKLLSDQGINVICCTISMFDDIRLWNRENIQNYNEIYLDVPIELLESRNQKGLYEKVKSGNIVNVVGMDLILELPKNPHIVIQNDGLKSPEKIVEMILEKLYK